MPSAHRRQLSLVWPTDDVTAVRQAYLLALRVYREPAPDDLSLTLSAFTETAYRQARARIGDWADQVPQPALDPDNRPPMAKISLSWDSAVARALDDDWDELATRALATPRQASPGGDTPPRLRVYRSEVARIGVLNGLTDWPSWIRSVPNDARRPSRT